MTLTTLWKFNLDNVTRGIDYSQMLDLFSITCDNQVLLVDRMSSPSGISIKSAMTPQHGCPTLVSFSPDSSHISVSDNDGPIDVFNLQSECLVRSYLEHGEKATGLDWFSSERDVFVSSSGDKTIRFYKLTERHSYDMIQMKSGVCGVRTTTYCPNLVTFGTSDGKFYIYDRRKLSSPYLEVKGHSRTVQ